MKTKLTILFLLITFICKGQTQNWISLNANYFPEPVLETNNFEMELAYNLGIEGVAEFLRVGAFAKSDRKFEHATFGLATRTTALKIGSNLDIAITTAVGMSNNQINVDGKGSPHFNHYVEYGADFELVILENVSVHQFLKRQFYTGKGNFYCGLGVTFKRK